MERKKEVLVVDGTGAGKMGNRSPEGQPWPVSC